MYRTGDLAHYRKDGIIEYLGRVANQVKIRGYRLDLGEIEATLASCPSAQTCVVLAREDTPRDKQLAAYLVSRADTAPAIEELQSLLEDKLPQYMVPAKFVFLDSLPFIHNDKVDRKALPVLLSERAQSNHNSLRPPTATEEVLADIWTKLLKIQNIGIHDDFFDLGGHSLLEELRN